MNKNIINLYDHFKSTPKKLKIICDWDEVIQPCEPYANYLEQSERNENLLEKDKRPFSEYFKTFWSTESKYKVEYSPYGSRFKVNAPKGYSVEMFEEKQQQIKNSPTFYHQAPFLTIAEDLLRLIKEDRVEKLIFLSAYDKREFPNEDLRKWKVFHQTFGQCLEYPKCSIKLIPFDNETQGQTKADWIKQNAPDFDIFIDDNPNICKSIVKNIAPYLILNNAYGGDFPSVQKYTPSLIVCSPYYPAVENQHDKNVLLVKNEVSNLKRKDFSE